MTLSPLAKRIALSLCLVAVLTCVGTWVSFGPNTSTKLVSFLMRKELIRETRRDAEKGIAEDQYNLGYFYSIGHGVERNQIEAVKWYRKAAEQDYARAQYSLGLHYQDGAGVAKDWVEAFAWYEVADNKRAAGTEGMAFPDMRAVLLSVMSAEQIESSKKRTEELRAQIATSLKAKNSGKP